MNTFTVSTRDIQRNYRNVVERVKQTGEVAILVSQKEPQAAIVSLDDLEKLQDARRKNSAKALLELAHEAREILNGEELPSDLSRQHDYYTWEEGPQK